MSSAAWQHEPGERPPAFGAQFRALDAALGHLLDKCLVVIAHEKQLVTSVGLCRVNGEFRRRERKDQPVVTRVDARILQDIPKERSIRLSV
jgi:hypothetical protein